MAKLETVAIRRLSQKLIINKSDFNPESDQLWVDEPEGKVVNDASTTKIEFAEPGSLDLYMEADQVSAVASTVRPAMDAVASESAPVLVSGFSSPSEPKKAEEKKSAGRPKKSTSK